jgi:uncharacterized protein YukJ
MRAGFLDYMSSQDYSSGYSADLTSYLDRYVTTITEPKDVISIFSRVKPEKGIYGSRFGFGLIISKH